ncbi:MAG: GtrA family protein [Anaerolineales bacterium]
MRERARRELTRFTKFAVVGTLGAVVDFGAFNLFRGGLGIPAILAQALSFSAALTSNFLWNRFWTYPDSRSKDWRRQATQFALVNLVGLAIRTPIFVLAEPGMIRFAERLLPTIPVVRFSIEAVALGSNLALAVAVIVVLFWNFGANRLWTYSDAR